MARKAGEFHPQMPHDFGQTPHIEPAPHPDSKAKMPQAEQQPSFDVSSFEAPGFGPPRQVLEQATHSQQGAAEAMPSSQPQAPTDAPKATGLAEKFKSLFIDKGPVQWIRDSIKPNEAEAAQKIEKGKAVIQEGIGQIGDEKLSDLISPKEQGPLERLQDIWGSTTKGEVAKQVALLASAGILGVVGGGIGALGALGIIANRLYRAYQAFRNPDAGAVLTDVQLDKASYRLANAVGKGKDWEGVRDYIKSELKNKGQYATEENIKKVLNIQEQASSRPAQVEEED